MFSNMSKLCLTALLLMNVASHSVPADPVKPASNISFFTKILSSYYRPAAALFTAAINALPLSMVSSAR